MPPDDRPGLVRVRRPDRERGDHGGRHPIGSTAASTAAATQSGPTTAAATQPTGLAYSGLNIQRDVEIGAALVAGGWAMQHWASRTPKPAADGGTEAGSAGDPS